MTDRMTAALYAAQVIANKKRKNPEAEIQRAIVKALRRALPHGLVHASINEQRKGNRRDQGIAIGMGAHPGFPDLLVMCEGRMLFIEVKAPKGTLSDNQKAFRDWSQAEGHAWALCRSVDDALAAARAAGFRLHGLGRDAVHAAIARGDSDNLRPFRSIGGLAGDLVAQAVSKQGLAE